MQLRSLFVAAFCFTPILTSANVASRFLPENQPLFDSKKPTIFFKNQELPSTEFNGYFIKRQYPNDTVIEDVSEDIPGTVPVATSTPGEVSSIPPINDPTSTESDQEDSESEVATTKTPEHPEDSATSSSLISSSTSSSTSTSSTGEQKPEQSHNAAPTSSEQVSSASSAESSTVTSTSSESNMYSYSNASSIESASSHTSTISSAPPVALDSHTVDTETVSARIASSTSSSDTSSSAPSSAPPADDDNVAEDESEADSVEKTCASQAPVPPHGYYTNSSVSQEELTTTITTTIYVTTTLSVKARVSVPPESKVATSSEESKVVKTVTDTKTICTEEKCSEPATLVSSEQDVPRQTLTWTTTEKVFTTECSGSTSTYTSTIVYTTTVCLSETETQSSKQTEAVAKPSISHVIPQRSNSTTSESTIPKETGLTTVRKGNSTSSQGVNSSSIYKIGAISAYEGGANVVQLPILMSSVVALFLCLF